MSNYMGIICRSPGLFLKTAKMKLPPAVVGVEC